MSGRREEQRNPIPSSSSSIVPGNGSSAAIVGSIEDLLREILVKLPIKSLGQFKSVCKSWLSLISNLRFFSHDRNPAHGILFEYISRIQYIPLYPNKNSISFLHSRSNKLYGPKILRSFNEELYRPEILRSSNGLILYSKKSTALYVCNPTTNRSVPLPFDPRATGIRRGAAIVLDPVKSQHYKVVIVRHLWHKGAPDQGSMYTFRIYSSETKTWSSGGKFITAEVFPRIQFDNGVYWNGSIHWIRYESKKGGLRFNVDTLVVLDEMPPAPRTHATYYQEPRCYFGESCGYLHFTECVLPQFNIYELASDYSEWFVMYRVDLSNLIAKYPEVKRSPNSKLPGTYITYVLSLVRGKNYESDSFLVLRTPEKAIKCNLVDGGLEELCYFNEYIPKDYNYRHEEYGYFVGFTDGYAVDYIPCLTDV